MMGQVRFWKILENGVRLPYGEFSNFSRNSFTVDGVYYATSEHYYQSRKFVSSELRDIVVQSNTPKDAATVGRNPELPMRSDWEEIKEDVMRMALWYKFSTHLSLVASLLGTGDKEIMAQVMSMDFLGRGGLIEQAYLHHPDHGFWEKDMDKLEFMEFTGKQLNVYPPVNVMGVVKCVKVFEGDIIQCTYDETVVPHEKELVWTGIVEYDYNLCGFHVRKFKGGIYSLSFSGSAVKTYQVIGNKWENPELVK